MKNPIKQVKIIRYEQEANQVIDGAAIVETPVTLAVNGEPWLTFMCTPVDLEALGVGFLYNEGLITSASEIAACHLCASGELLDIWLEKSVEPPKQWRRTSGCTGGLTADRQPERIELKTNGYLLPERAVTALLADFYEVQGLYQQAGGIHTAALSDGERILLVTEDIGRHNTLDKISGRVVLENLQMKQKVILTTGRISSEMLQKAARLGAAVLISRTAPSSLAIEMAGNYGITIIGYARRNRFQVYTHPERILQNSKSPANQPIF